MARDKLLGKRMREAAENAGLVAPKRMPRDPMKERFSYAEPDDSYGAPDEPYIEAVPTLRYTLSKMLGFTKLQDDATLLKAVRAREEERELLVPRRLIRYQLKFAGDLLDRHAAAMQKKGARLKDHYAMNQLAHWLWQLDRYYR